MKINNLFFENSLNCFGNLLYKTQHFSKIQDYFVKVDFVHLFLSIFENPKYFWEKKICKN